MVEIYPNKINSDYKAWNELLRSQNIKPEANVDRSFGVFQSDKLVATASVYKNIIKCVAIDDEFKGGAMFNELISDVLSDLYRRNYNRVFVYTKPEAKRGFEALGFKEIEYVAGHLVFMEKAQSGFDDYLKAIEGKRIACGDVISAIVINANPITLGHMYLIENAAKESDHLHIFVVSEDRSEFPADVRRRLVEDATAHLKNITIHDTNDYLISSATFPSYFLKEEDDVTAIQSELDARIFKYHIAKALCITDRYVGDEPFSKTTNIYNRTMSKVFENVPDQNYPKLHIIERFSVDGEIISASKVRSLISEGKINEAKRFLPKATCDYLDKK